MAFLDTTLVALRESLEAFLIISIFAGLVVKLGHPQARRHLLWGAAAAFAASVVLGAAILWGLGASEIPKEELFEGVAALVAVGILTYMIVWMYRHTLTMVGDLRSRAKHALDAGRPAVLFGIAFVAVFREGLETVLFFAARTADTTGLDLVLSALTGIAASATFAFLLFSGIVRLNLQRFFAASGVLLIFFAGGLLVQAVHEFTEEGLLPETATAWDTGLSHKEGVVGPLLNAVLGYRAAPTVLEVGAYALYVLGLGAWYLRGLFAHARGRAALAADEPRVAP